jgi:hypothetical protein
VDQKTGLKAKPELDDAFMFYWIALSALYGKRDPEITELCGLMTFLERVDRSEDVRNVRRDLRARIDAILADPFLHQANWNHWAQHRIVDYQTRINEQRSAKRERTELQELFGSLYTLRNQLFHGCRTRGSSVTGRTLHHAVVILGVLIPLFEQVVREASTDKAFRDPPYRPSENRRGATDGLSRVQVVRK